MDNIEKKDKLEKIKDKIKKLLKLSGNNPSEEESYAALQRAQALMVEYKLTEQDVADEEILKKGCIERETNCSYGTRSSDHYIEELAKIIADNFCCVNYIRTAYYSRTHRVVFMGFEDDVDIAEEALYAANACIIRGYNKVYKEACRTYLTDYLPAKYFNPLKKGYIQGYLSGLKEALEKQRKAHQEEWGLVLVTPQEAVDFFAGLGGRDTGSDGHTDLTYYETGYNDGSKFNMNKKIKE